MRAFAAAVLIAALFSNGAASAQDDEAGEDLDALMSGDPERPEPSEEAEDAEGEAAEQPEGISEEMLRMGDDERPPGDERPRAAKAKERDAEADSAGDGHPYPISLGVLAGYGLSLDSAGGNAWTFGFGLRGGYNLDALYLGARFVYYVGETFDMTTIGVLGGSRIEEVTVNLIEFGFEGGYDIDTGDLAFRPGFGFGFASVSGNQTEGALFVAPGLSMFYEVSETVFLGLDVRYQAVLTTPSESGLVLLANVGMRL